MALTLDDLYRTPDHYLHSFENDAAVFVPMDRASYRRSIFLDARIQPASAQQMRLPLATVAQGARTPLPTAFIFHIAHCGSTLLARALDEAGSALVLREPLALRQAAVQRHEGLLAIAAATASKRYDPAVRTLVKANVPVNFVLPQLAATMPDGRALFLHLPLRDYLPAILRSDNHRQWLRNVTALLAPVLGDLSGADDAKRAATLWLAQMQAFADALVRWPGSRTLDAEQFFAQPRDTLLSASAVLDVALDPSRLDAVVAGPLFATYSKNPAEPFDNAARIARRRQVEQAIAAELEEAERIVDGGANLALAAIKAASLLG